jgi:uncharacterized protein (DUF2147 family)
MRIFARAAILSLIGSGMAGSANAAEPTPIGDWRVKDGYANIRIDNCGGKLWGIVAWEKEAGFDKENPDPAKKGRPILGMPILMAMGQAGPNKWQGEIYNSQDGNMYSANVSLLDENTLKLQGCALFGIVCGGENWTRVTNPPTGGVSLPALPKSGGQVRGAPKGATAQGDTCARVAASTAGHGNTAPK